MTKTKKLDIVVYSVDFPREDQARQAFDQLRAADKEFNYPFGFRKMQMHGPFKTEEGNFRVFSSVHLYVHQYIRKCAYSHSPRLRSICAGWIKIYYPEQASYFSDICNQADAIKLSILQRNVAIGR